MNKAGTCKGLMRHSLFGFRIIRCISAFAQQSHLPKHYLKFDIFYISVSSALSERMQTSFIPDEKASGWDGEISAIIEPQVTVSELKYILLKIEI